jgi:hypothetical protein
MRPSAEPAEDLSGLFRAHHLELVRLAAFVIGDVAAGEDVVQDVFVRLHQRWDSLAVQRDPLPYLPPHPASCQIGGQYVSHGDQFDRAAHCPARVRAELIQGILSVP